MIPYFSLTHIPLGPLNIQVWGFFVSLGILVGAWTAARMARRRGQNEQVIWDLTVWVIVGAFLFARLAHVLGYEPAFYLVNPAEIFRLWHGGFSIAGGFLGAVIFGIVFLRKKQVDVWAYVDTAIYGLPIGLAIGRIGCFLIHDHPGTATDFVLGVQYPDGVVRHDHGLYLALNGLVLAIVFFFLAKKSPPFLRGDKGGFPLFAIVFLLWYGLVRFFLDFLRATDGAIVDARYWSLTPAQYFSLAMFFAGLILLAIHLRQRKKTKDEPSS